MENRSVQLFDDVADLMRRDNVRDEEPPETSSVVVQRADERYHGEHGWLRTDHAFSPNYDEPATMHFGALHVFIEHASKLVTTGSGEAVLWDVSWTPSIW